MSRVSNNRVTQFRLPIPEAKNDQILQKGKWIGLQLIGTRITDTILVTNSEHIGATGDKKQTGYTHIL